MKTFRSIIVIVIVAIAITACKGGYYNATTKNYTVQCGGQHGNYR